MHATPPAHPGTVETCESRRQILYYGRTTSVLQSDEFGLNLPRRRILYYGRTASVLRSGEFGLNLPQRLILHCGRTTSVLQSADFGLGVRCCTAGVVLLHYRATSSVSTCPGFAVAGMRPWLVGTLAPGRTVVGGCLVPGGLRPGWLRPWQRGITTPRVSTPAPVELGRRLLMKSFVSRQTLTSHMRPLPIVMQHRVLGHLLRHLVAPYAHPPCISSLRVQNDARRSLMIIDHAAAVVPQPARPARDLHARRHALDGGHDVDPAHEVSMMLSPFLTRKEGAPVKLSAPGSPGACSSLRPAGTSTADPAATAPAPPRA